MKLHELAPDPGARRPSRRIGRGLGSGRGVTAGKGTKGQKARQGIRMIPGFEGGQIRMIKRLPHRRGFTNQWRVEYETFPVGLLGRLFSAQDAIDHDVLRERGMRTTNLPIKVLGNGDIKIPLSVTAHRISATARAKIEAAGGTVVELGTKTVQGKRRDIQLRDVAILHGEPPRVRKPGSRAATRASAPATTSPE